MQAKIDGNDADVINPGWQEHRASICTIERFEAEVGSSAVETLDTSYGVSYISSCRLKTSSLASTRPS